MDNERAKTILSAYHGDAADAGEPLFAEALAQVQCDPELARWFQEECALNERMRAAVQSLRPPAHLRDTLLLTEKVSRMPAPRAWWTRPAWVAAAAALVLLTGLAVFALRPERSPLTLAGVTAEIGRMQREDSISLGAMTNDPEQARRWLKANDGRHNFAIPAGLAGKPSLGCQVLDVRGNKVSLVCFQVGGGEIVHLLVMDRREFADAPVIGKLMLIQEGELAFASWSDAECTYILAGHGRAEALRQWL